MRVALATIGFFIGCGATVAHPPGGKEIAGLSYAVDVRFEAAKPGSGAPTLHFKHQFANQTGNGNIA